jgi:hypothetical protein
MRLILIHFQCQKIYNVDKSQPLICVTLEIDMVKVNVFNDFMVTIDWKCIWIKS